MTLLSSETSVLRILGHSVLYLLLIMHLLTVDDGNWQGGSGIKRVCHAPLMTLDRGWGSELAGRRRG
ncbi:hypothetical protein NP284_31610 [Rhodopseudomonas pseudopalustris]|jgi:hypothetical protein|uniref:hypothetical protein n=1 Tax=Rhodopseudomonas pseudopalustris TaxID=1513892 RepID=UPI0011AF368D